MPSTAIGLMRGLGDQLTDVDDAFLGIVGYTREDFQRGAMNWRAMTPPEFLPLDEAGIAQALRAESGGFTVPYRKEFYRKDGSRVPVLLCCAFVPDAAPGTWMGYVVDLSTPAAQHAEPSDAVVPLRTVEPNSFYVRFIGELVRERTRLLAVFDSTTSLMWSVDRSLRLTSANEAFQQRIELIIGRRLAIGEPVLAIGYPDEVRAEWAGWYAEVLSGTPITRHTTYPIAGRTRTFAHALTPYRNSAGEVVGVAGVSHDISALKAAEHTAALREQDLLEAQRIARVGSWEWDPDRDTVSWSDTMYDMFGWPREQPPPAFADHHLLLTPESWERLQRVARTAVESFSAYEIELEVAPGRPARFVVARGEPRRASSGAPSVMHGVVLDVTERRQAEAARRALEQQLLQSQKLQALGQLAGGVAHDFNNILTSILLQLGTMRDEVPPQSYLAASLDEVDRAARRASALTQQLLMFSRRQAPDLRRVELSGVVHDFSRMLQRLLGEQYTLEVIAGATPGCVHGDRGMLEQVIMNLVLNARDAMKPGGRIVLRTRSRVVTAREIAARADVPAGLEPGRFIELSVTDTGCGIPLDMQSRVFEPFFTTKAAGSGTGLGLATAYGIVAQHRGWMEFSSQPGEGTTFRVYLPERETDAAGAMADGGGEQARVMRARGDTVPRILVVEDETVLRALIERMLRQYGFEVVGVGDVAAAERAWESDGSFDVVLSDIVLPGEHTGIDLVRALRARHHGVRAVLMTGYTEEMGLPGFEERVGVPVLQKPFDIATLLDVLSAVLVGR